LSFFLVYIYTSIYTHMFILIYTKPASISKEAVSFQDVYRSNMYIWKYEQMYMCIHVNVFVYISYTESAGVSKVFLRLLDHIFRLCNVYIHIDVIWSNTRKIHIIYVYRRYRANKRSLCLYNVYIHI